MKAIPDITSNAYSNTSAQILDNIRKASEIIAVKKNSDYSPTDDGQVELLRKIEFRSLSPGSGISMLDYSKDTKAMLSSAETTDADEWIEV